MSKQLILAQDLYKSFGKGALAVTVLNGVNLSIESGDTVAIVGASGSGKSTLMHILGGLDAPDRGQVTIDGSALFDLSESERGSMRNRKLGFVYQFHYLLPEFSLQENVAMPLLIRRQKPSLAMEEAAAILAKVGLGERLQHKPGEISGGERQRAAIARALVTGSSCILADEPTGNLDEKTAHKVFDLLQSLNQTLQTSLIIVTHNMHLAKQMRRVFELHNGILRPYNSKMH